MHVNQVIQFGRIERKSVEGSSKIIKMINHFITNQVLPPSNKISIPNKTFSQEQDYKYTIKIIEKSIYKELETIDPTWAIPLLLEIWNQIYYCEKDKDEDVREWEKDFGCGVKRAIAYLSKYVYKNKQNHRKNINQLFEVIYVSYIISELYSAYVIFLFDNNFKMEIQDKKIKELNDDSKKIAYNFLLSMKGRGKRQRVCNDVNKAIVRHLDGCYIELLSLINGVKTPKDISYFQGTIFEKIYGPKRSDTYKYFWENIIFRLSLIIQIAMKRQDINKASEVFIVSLSQFKTQIPDSILNFSFWNYNWYNDMPSSLFDNLIMIKPLIKISGKDEFVTSIPLLLDSITAFVEEAIIHYTSGRNTILHLPDVFKSIISDPFEEKCITLLRKKDFKAGHVNDNSVWLRQDKNIKLNASSNFPGEVDVLAYHEDYNMLFLVECKAIRDIHNPEAFRNLIVKIVDDDEGYRGKLEDKSKWLTEALNKAIPNVEPLKFIICDIPLPFFPKEINNIFYLSYDHFSDVVDKMIVQQNSK